MRGAVFADTGFWIARLSPLDRLHGKARDVARALGGTVPILTSELVLVEMLNAFSGGGVFVRERAARLVDTLCADVRVEIVSHTPALFADALALFRERGDKAWSLTDCASFSIMRRRGIKSALAHDRHFEQAGFKALLRE